jgi:hypothetical protein
MLWDIELIFGMWVYNDKLQIKFTFRSGPMNFNRVMALGLWNLAKYLVVTTLFHYNLRYWLDFWYFKLDVSWILRRLAYVSAFFNSLSNRLIITNYCLRSVFSSLLKFTWFIQGNNIAWTNLDTIRNLQHLHMNKKSYTYKTLPFNSHWIFFWIKSVMWSK